MNLKLLILVFLTSAGCNPAPALLQKSWNRSQSESVRQKMLTQISQMQWSSSTFTQFSDFQIENSIQTYRGVPMMGSYLKVVSDKKFNPYLLHFGLNSDFKKHPLRPVNEELLESMKSNLTQSGSKILSYQNVQIFQDSEVVNGVHFVIESQAGVIEKVLNHQFQLIRETSPASFFDVSTKIYPLGPKRSELLLVWLQGLVDVQKISTLRSAVTSENGALKIDFNQSLQFETQNPKFDQVQAFFHLERSLKWFEENFNYRPPQKVELVVNFGYPEKINAAFYHSGKIRIGDGDGISYSQMARDPSIIIHESAHSVIQAVSHLPFDGEGGSLNEGFADFFAAVQLNNPFLGEDSYLKGPFKRNLNQFVKLTEKNGGLYHDSLILSGALWEIHTSLGAKKSLKIVSLLLIEMHPHSTFENLSEIFQRIVAPNFDPLDQKRISEILKKRGFG